MALKIDAQPNAPVTRERVAQAPNAHDFRQFAALRRGADARDPATLREVARQFESIFTKMMLDGMRKASFGDPLFGSDQADQYQDMMDDQLAVQLSQGKGLGLGDMLIRQLSQGTVDPSAATGVAHDRQGHPRTTAQVHRGNAAACHRGRARTRRGSARHHRAGRARNRVGHCSTGGRRRRQSQPVWHQGRRFVEGRQRVRRDHRVRRWNRPRQPAQFRAYGSVAENVADYVHVLRDNPRYAAALGTGGDVRAFADALQRGGYATDPEYANKLVAVADQVAQRLPLAADVNSFKPAPDAPITSPRVNNG